MAIIVHVAHVALRKINSVSGDVLTKDNTTETLKQHMQFDLQHRVIEDANIPNTSGSPTVDDYLAAEAAGDFVLQHMDQGMIVTYQRTAGGGFA